MSLGRSSDAGQAIADSDLPLGNERQGAVDAGLKPKVTDVANGAKVSYH